MFVGEVPFEFGLPPGGYQLEAEDDVTAPRNTHRLNPYNHDTLATNLRDVENENLELTPKPLARTQLRVRIKQAKEKGTWVGIQERYGSPAPDWHIIDARGLKKNATVAAYRRNSCCSISGDLCELRVWKDSCLNSLDSTTDMTHTATGSKSWQFVLNQHAT